MSTFRRMAGIALRTPMLLGILLGCLCGGPALGQPVASAATALLDPRPDARASAIRALAESNDPSAIAPLIQHMYWAGEREQRNVVAALAALTGETFNTWFEWQTWQQEQPALVPFAGYDAWLAEVLTRIDPGFRRFIRAGMAHSIRLEEIVWGGVKVDGIPALDRPRTTAADGATWLAADDLVFGVEINGDARAYPLRILDWHEMANDVVGGVPVSIAYCTLCGAAILFDGRTPGRPPFDFGSSGLLYRSNKLMYDRQTNSLWNQFTGEPVAGSLVGSGIRLTILPLVTTNWSVWRAQHPKTRVLAQQTGFARDYRSGAAYGAYFASNALMFPAAVADPARQKDVAFGLRVPGGVKVWPLERFAGGAVINDQVGLLNVVLIGDAQSRTVRAYEAQGRQFVATANPVQLTAAGETWQITETALTGPQGQSLRRLPGHLGYRFAWDGFFGAGVNAP